MPDSAPAKKKPGRPRKNSDPGQQAPATPQQPVPPKSPRRPSGPDLLGKQEAAQQASAQQVADEIANKAIIRKLMLYVRKFPEFAPPPSYNPYVHTPQGNLLVIQAMELAIHAEIEFLTAPAVIRDSIVQAEKGAMWWAMKNPDNPAAAVVSKLHQTSDAVLSDPACDLDIRLLECQVSDFLPKNPKWRLALNAGRVILKTFANNAVAKPTTPEGYSEF